MSRDNVKKLFLVLSLVVIIFLGMSALGPAYTEVERSVSVSVEQEDAYAYLVNLDHLKDWHFWKTYDPNMVFETKPPFSTEGGSVTWQGNEQVGKGTMKIYKADAPRYIELQLIYAEPWDATATNSFTIMPNDSGSEITWKFSSKNSFISRMSMLFISMDKLLGADYERGLYALKTELEK